MKLPRMVNLGKRQVSWYWDDRLLPVLHSGSNDYLLIDPQLLPEAQTLIQASSCLQQPLSTPI